MRTHFKELHKKRSPKWYQSDPNSVGDQRVDYLVHCAICGMTNDVRRETPGDGAGYKLSTDSDGNTIQVHTGGCWFCYSRSNI